MLQTLARAFRRVLPRNSRINRLVRPATTDALLRLPDVETSVLELSELEHRRWVAEFLPNHKFSSELFKKPIEFFATYRILETGPDDVVLDAAGGVYTYLHRLPARRRIMQDLAIPESLRRALGDGIEYVESDAGAIPLPDASVDKISCHHSFEHFEGDSDTRFVVEVQRLLAPGGRAVILPLFVAERFFEITSQLGVTKQYDRLSHHVVDPTATLPGGNAYARVYDVDALERRVLRHVDRGRFRVRIIELHMGGRAVPDLEHPANRKVAWINRPFRALVIDRQ